MMGGMGGMDFGFGLTGLLTMLLFWVVIIGVAIWLLARLFPSGPAGMNSQANSGGSAHDNGNRPDSAESAVEIVRQRYARGEISRDEYEQLRQDLGAY